MHISKELHGYLSIVMALVSYAFYFRSVMLGNTRPHAFSWVTWGLLTSVAFYAQYTHAAGPGAWATGLVAALCFGVAFLALFKGEKRITRSDCIMFTGALMVLPLWYFTQSALSAVVMIMVIDALGGYYPTFRKSYEKPREETLFLYVISIVQVVLSLLAMEHYYAVNILYPIFIIVANFAFIVMVMWRRRYSASI